MPGSRAPGVTFQAALLFLLSRAQQTLLLLSSSASPLVKDKPHTKTNTDLLGIGLVSQKLFCVDRLPADCFGVSAKVRKKKLGRIPSQAFGCVCVTPSTMPPSTPAATPSRRRRGSTAPSPMTPRTMKKLPPRVRTPHKGSEADGGEGIQGESS